MARLAPRVLADLHSALDRRLVAGHDDLTAAIVIRGVDDLLRAVRACCGLRADGARLLDVDADQRRHRAVARRHRLLHRPPAQPQQPRGFGDN